jgi:hypothetical protein
VGLRSDQRRPFNNYLDTGQGSTVRIDDTP